jgi:DNA invertase Pin-like site-specific DNA recombinase
MTTAKTPAGHRIGYRRVSTLDQATDRQLDGVALDIEFEDKASGKDAQRPQLQAALKHARAGDTFICHSMDRLARNLDDLRRIVDDLTGRGVAVQFIKEGMTFTGKDDPMARLMLSVMGAFAEFERSLIRERQREGIEIAKAKGVYKGRKPSLTGERLEALRARLKEPGKVNMTQLAKDFGISRETLYQYKRELGVTSPCH